MSLETIPTPDRELADRLLAHRDERAFRELYRRHTPAVHQLALRLLGGTESDADDVVQEAWIRATTALGEFRWESSFRTWLTGIALNLCRAVHRSRGRRDVVALDDELTGAVQAAAHAERIDLERAIALLPPGYRSVLVLHDVEGWTHEEIGTRLGIAAGTSKSQLSHARKAVRTMLGWRKEEDHELRA